MRKLLAVILFVMLMAFPVLTFAEEVEPTEKENVPPVEEAVTEEKFEPTMTEKIVTYVKENIEEIFVIVAGLLFTFYETMVRRKTLGSVGTLNNNAVSIAENSAKAIETSIAKVEDMANTVKQVNPLIDGLRLALLEMSNMMAELLVLSNIPNSKKEELYARHTQAIRRLEKVEEVIKDDGEKA